MYPLGNFMFTLYTKIISTVWLDSFDRCNQCLVNRRTLHWEQGGRERERRQSNRAYCGFCSLCACFNQRSQNLLQEKKLFQVSPQQPQIEKTGLLGKISYIFLSLKIHSIRRSRKPQRRLGLQSKESVNYTKIRAFHFALCGQEKVFEWCQH